ncbi:MAG: D-glycero-beta-D-manno-heptose 1-phosphate adenylyltransferase [Candidatus Marinimicrobia bacterium]|nr:D-glycero-beta-D-manno-heptose 1-phosphate adenylyltransferase [Candidatus Neomarinimicrobiota bacterium]|tara:strand:+ start:25 stop:504 length:480 start_codon:yes stop_codon:yes gene_type:complete
MFVKDKYSILEIINKLRESNRSIVFTNGCFDLLHKGHLHLFKSAIKEGDFLIVAINSDQSILRLKGQGRPIQSENERVKALTKLKSLDLVTIFDQDTPFDLIKFICPDVLVKGGDYNRKDIVGGDFVKSKGGRVVVVPILKGFSTSSKINEMLISETKT